MSLFPLDRSLYNDITILGRYELPYNIRPIRRLYESDLVLQETDTPDVFKCLKNRYGQVDNYVLFYFKDMYKEYITDEDLVIT